MPSCLHCDAGVNWVSAHLPLLVRISPSLADPQRRLSLFLAGYCFPGLPSGLPRQLCTALGASRRGVTSSSVNHISPPPRERWRRGGSPAIPLPLAQTFSEASSLVWCQAQAGLSYTSRCVFTAEFTQVAGRWSRDSCEPSLCRQERCRVPGAALSCG